jgi:hypothetical protein
VRPSTRKAFWIGIGTIAALAVTWDFIPLNDASARLKLLPTSGLGFASRELPLSDTERQVFGKAALIKRVYQVGSDRIILQIVDGTRDRHAVHDPLYCFRGSGWTVTQQRDRPIPGGTARHLILSRNGTAAEAIFWLSDGRERHSSPSRYWWQTALRRLTLGRSGSEPVLIILQPWPGQTISWDDVLTRIGPLFEI